MMVFLGIVLYFIGALGTSFILGYCDEKMEGFAVGVVLFWPAMGPVCVATSLIDLLHDLGKTTKRNQEIRKVERKAQMAYEQTSL